MDAPAEFLLVAAVVDRDSNYTAILHRCRRKGMGTFAAAGKPPIGASSVVSIGGPELAKLFYTVFHESPSRRTSQFPGFGFLLASGLFGGSLLHFRATRVFGDFHFLNGLIHSAFFAGLGSGFYDVK